jgi:uncharacterized membrane protein YfcA
LVATGLAVGALSGTLGIGGAAALWIVYGVRRLLGQKPAPPTKPAPGPDDYI